MKFASFVACGLLAGSALAAVPAQAQVTYYTDEAAFLAALGGMPSVEDFNDTNLVAGLSYSSTVGVINGGVFSDRLSSGSDTTTFSFGQAVNGFGGFFDLSPDGAGVGIAFTPEPGTRLSMELPRTYTGQFFGFISADAFTSLLLTAGHQMGNAEAYTLDNMTFGARSSGVPEPAAWGMMLAGFGLAGTALRRRQTVRVAVRYAA